MIEKTLNTMNTIVPKDKLLHSFFGNIIYIVSLSSMLLVGLFIQIPMITMFAIAFLLTLIIATCKEVYDYFNKDKHTPDYMDIAYTVHIPFIITIIVILKLILGV